MGNATVAVGCQEHHLSFPAIRAEGPAVAEHHRLPCAPILVVDLRTVFRRDRAHGLSPTCRGVIDLSCPSRGWLSGSTAGARPIGRAPGLVRAASVRSGTEAQRQAA